MQDDNIMALLDTVITLQMSAENLDRLQQTPFNKQKVKTLIKQLLKEVDPIVQKNYNKIFGIDQETTQSIISEYERHVKYLAPLDIPTTIAFAQFTEAWNKDREVIEKLIHKIIKNEETK